MDDSDDDRSKPTVWTEVGRGSGLGLTWALSTLLFLGGGWWLDGRAGTLPLFTILGAFIGAGAGFYHIYNELMTDSRSDRDKPE